MPKSTILAATISVVLLTLTTSCSLSKKVSNQFSDKYKPNPTKTALATHLQNIGAKMYGTHWCLACKGQKKEFGQEAFSKINYIECDPGGANPQVALCDKAQLTSYPTWEIKGKLTCQGGCSLDDLADLSGYKGERKFK
jgi:hypothetical protein